MKLITLILSLLVSSAAVAGQGLIINAAEIGVGKFHRYDNKVHAYAENNAWKPYVLPDSGSLQTPIVYPNPDGSVTIQFSTLEELLRTAIQVSAKADAKIQVLNINGHGLPGGMWYPKDDAQLKSSECASWRSSAAAPDKENYGQYYSPVPKYEIFMLKQSASHPAHYACVTGLPEWTEIAGRIPNLRGYFADDAQIHFLSCLVGYGNAGEVFSQGVAALILSANGKAMVKSSLKFGLGDWSMPEGMGFWDYVTDEQLDHDNAIYPVNKKDREIAQTGTVRASHFFGGAWGSHLIADQNYMVLGMAYPGFSNPGRVAVSPKFTMNPLDAAKMPMMVRIPGTTARAVRLR